MNDYQSPVIWMISVVSIGNEQFITLSLVIYKIFILFFTIHIWFEIYFTCGFMNGQLWSNFKMWQVKLFDMQQDAGEKTLV